MVFNMLPRWWYSASKSTQRGRRPARRSFRPQLEWLEDRVVPSTFNVTTHADVVDPNDGKLSLREAITRANNHDNSLNSGGVPDVIVLPAGVFKMQVVGADDLNMAGDFDVTDSVTRASAFHQTGRVHHQLVRVRSNRVRVCVTAVRLHLKVSRPA